MINLVQYFFWSYFFPTSLQITIIILNQFQLLYLESQNNQK